MPVILLGGTRLAAPNEIAGCTGWWKAGEEVYSDAGSTPAVNNDPLYRWGNAIDASYVEQATLGNRPIYKTAIVNGLPAVQFDGSDDVLNTSAALSTLLAVGAKTVFVIHYSTGAANAELLGDTADKIGFYVSGATGGSLNAANDDGAVDTATKATHANSVWTCGTLLHSGGTLYVGVNDGRTASMASVASGNTTSLAGTGKFGATVVTTNPFGGYIAEVATFNVAVAEDDRVAIERYFAAKFGITLAY